MSKSDFDGEGHSTLSPAQLQDRLNDRRSLINRILIPATPVIFETRDRFHDFTEYLSDNLHVHPRNFVLRGSTLLGFSMTPSPEKVWMAYGPKSDIDLAIIDPDYYHVIDREVRHVETRTVRDAGIRGESQHKRDDRRNQRRFYCYRYFDLPDIPAALNQQETFKNLNDELLDCPRSLEAFIYRDWWSFFSRWENDLKKLNNGLHKGDLVQGGPTPRTL